MAVNVWDRLAVNGLALGGSTVYWYLDYRLQAPEPWVFTVYWAPQQSGPWTALGSTEHTFFIDPIRRRFGVTKDSYYKIELTTGDNTKYESPIVSERGVWTRHEYLLAREIARKEYLLQSKYTGRKGLLFKRYVTGSPCTACLDYDTNEVLNSHCTVCFGTGLIGGYAPPLEVWVTADNYTFGATYRDNADLAETISLEARIVGFPDLQTGDFWVDINTDDRFLVRKISVIAAIRGQSIVNSVELRLVPATDIIYSVPRVPAEAMN